MRDPVSILVSVLGIIVGVVLWYLSQRVELASPKPVPEKRKPVLPKLPIRPRGETA
jgi:hypothetical protein